MFLRKLEYFGGLLFLTTNKVEDFDDAVLNRIHLKLKYDDLDRNARKSVFVNLLKGPDQRLSNISDEELDRLAGVKLNGREVSLNHEFEKLPLMNENSDQEYCYYRKPLGL